MTRNAPVNFVRNSCPTGTHSSSYSRVFNRLPIWLSIYLSTHFRLQVYAHYCPPFFQPSLHASVNHICERAWIRAYTSGRERWISTAKPALYRTAVQVTLSIRQFSYLTVAFDILHFSNSFASTDDLDRMFAERSKPMNLLHRQSTVSLRTLSVIAVRPPLLLPSRVLTLRSYQPCITSHFGSIAKSSNN